jgi:hypothetical protein
VLEVSAVLVLSTSLFSDRLGSFLQIGVADGGIEIQRRFFDSLELLEIP